MVLKDDPIIPDSSQPPGAIPPARGTSGEESPTTPPPRRLKRGLILKILVAVLFAIVLLVALAPTLFSTDAAVSIIVGQVNKRLNGRIEIASLSLGWFTGVNVKGVRVFDIANAQIAQLEQAAVPLPLWKAVIGRYSLGNVLVEGLSFDARLDAQGHSNFDKLLKSNPTAGASTTVQTPPAKSAPSKLPNISGDIKITNCRGTVSQPDKPTIYLTKLDVELKIPDINQVITDSVSAILKMGEQPEGEITAIGTASVIKGNLIALDSAEVHQTLDVQNLALAAAKPFLPADRFDTLEGVVGSHVAIDITNGKTARFDATFSGKQKIVVGGKALKGDTFNTDVFTIAIPKLTAEFPDTLANWKTGRIKVGADAGTSPVLLQIDQGQMTLAVNSEASAILNVMAGNKPGTAGSLILADHFDLAAIARQLPHLLHVANGVTVSSGVLAQNVKGIWTPDKATLSATTDVTNLRGQRTAAGAAGPTPINLSPIHLAIDTADLGGGNLNVDGGLAVGLFDYSGLTVKDLDVPFTIRKGILLTGGPASQKPAVANDGQLYVDNIKVDLTQATPRVSTPANKLVLAHATINPIFASTWLKSIINNPVFSGAQSATGLVDVTVVACDRLPAGKLMQQAIAANDGTATIKFSLTELHIGSEGLGKALGAVMGSMNTDNGQGGMKDSFTANVKDATVTLAHGIATQDITFQTGRYNIGFNGKVNLASEQLMPLNVNIPGSAIARIFTHDQNVLNSVPPQVAVVMTGTVSSPTVRWDQIGHGLISKAGQNLIGNILKKQLGNTVNGKDDNGRNPASQPANPDDPAELLRRLLQKQLEKKKK